MDSITVSRLPNGIIVVSEKIPYVESFSLGFWFNLGTRDENRKNNGVSHFIEHMLFKGTKLRSAKRISEEVEACGGYLNAFTTKEHTCFYGRGLSSHWRSTFRVIADMIQNPLFRAADVELERGVILDELNDINDNPEELIFDTFEEMIFSGNSLSFPIIGNETNITQFDAQFLSTFHANRYGRNNLMIVCSGKVTHEELMREAERSLTKKFPQVRSSRKNCTAVKSGRNAVVRDIEQVHTILGRTGPGMTHPDSVPLGLLLNVLGDGASSRLFQAVREKRGICYQINTFLNSYFDISTLGVYFSSSKKNMPGVLQGIKKEFKKLRERGLTEKDLFNAKESLKGHQILSLESTTNRMIRIAHSMLYHKRVMTQEEMTAEIDSIDTQTVLRLADSYFDYDTFSQVYVSAHPDICETAV